MSLTREQVQHVATLARLELSEEELETFRRQLSDIIAYVQQLERLDTAGVEPTFHVVPVSAPLAADEPRPSIAPEEALANAPARSGTSFAVPKVIDS
jgi:aspartyl-tRNA(Asn)/glutamyl-tRNA(Gln) amidotransferase subunit C